ncbi:MAG TPA: RDD family protein, partial [Pyrinomonadaceae bacterium]
MTDNSNVTTRNTQSANNSTLIEFPGVNRNRPAWRKELSERFREIQQRRAREADVEGEEPPSRAYARPTPPAPEGTNAPAVTSETASKQLGLVPPQEEPEVNPLVAKALRRIERARAAAQPAAHHSGGRAQAATAAARIVEEQPEEVAEAPAPQPPPLVVVQPKQKPAEDEPAEASKAEPAPAEAEEPKAPARAAAARATLPEATAAAPVKSAEVPAESGRKVSTSQVTTSQVAPPQPEASAAGASAQDGERRPRHIAGVLDEFWLERQGIELLPKVEEKELTYDDRAPRVRRMAAAVADLLAVALLSAPFAAAIELTIGNWGDQRVWGSMALIAALVMFLYHTCSVALAGRTLGMSLCGLQAVDARK